MDLDDLVTRALAEIAAVSEPAALEEVQRRTLGKKGSVTAAFAALRELPAEARSQQGRLVNDARDRIARALEQRKQALLDAADAGRDAGFDPTLPPIVAARGSLHPLTQLIRELEDLFEGMGFRVLDGPEVERSYYNFDALNIPPDHPARDSQDTFFIEGRGELVLRTHTSPVQVRALETLSPPFRAVVPGKVFRHESTDASHEHTFHQMEGMVVDRGVTVGHLIAAMRTLLRHVFGRDLEVRLRPGFFPFVEPGFELDARCPFCSKGCSVCKQSTWIELLPCGLIHPNVLRMGGVDPDEWGGFAFGLGLSRLVMLRYGINDVRLLLSSGKLSFLEQF